MKHKLNNELISKVCSCLKCKKKDIRLLEHDKHYPKLMFEWYIINIKTKKIYVVESGDTFIFGINDVKHEWYGKCIWLEVVNNER
jgi:hypothetical protein